MVALYPNLIIILNVNGLNIPIESKGCQDGFDKTNVTIKTDALIIEEAL